MSARLRACVAALGGRMTGPMRASVPGPNHSKRDASVSLLDTGTRVLYNTFSMRDSDAEVARYLEAHGVPVGGGKQRPLSNTERRRIADANAKHERERVAKAASRWAEGYIADIGGCGRRYFASRHLSAATIALACRGGLSVREHRDERGRLSILKLARDRNGKACAVQMTKLKSDGSGKRGDSLDRITWGVLRGAAVQVLAPADQALAVCEGLEDALAFYEIHKIPAWAALGASNLQQFEPPAGVKRLFIAADGDAAGKEAAEKLFSRLRSKLRVTFALPPDDLDWADVLAAKKGRAQ